MTFPERPLKEFAPPVSPAPSGSALVTSAGSDASAFLSIGHLVRDAIAKLRALREGDLAVLDLISCGDAAVAPLTEFLFAREPSGLFEPRCHAVEALAALSAKDVLMDFLTHPRALSDPVEETGEEAVTNAVARALVKWPDDEVFSLLLSAGRRKPLAGVVEALGEFRREETIPILAAALAEDFPRPEAEEAFRKLGPSACADLVRLANWPTPPAAGESESSKRRRRSALKLLGEVLPEGELPASIPALTRDADPELAFRACVICLSRVQPEERKRVLARLADLRASGDWLLADAIDDLLREVRA